MSMSCPEREVLLIVVESVLYTLRQSLTLNQQDLLREFLDARPEAGGPSKEKQLLEALDRYGLDQNLTIDLGPSAELTIPLADGSIYRIPLALLTNAPDVRSKTSVTRRAKDKGDD